MGGYCLIASVWEMGVFVWDDETVLEIVVMSV